MDKMRCAAVALGGLVAAVCLAQTPSPTAREVSAFAKSARSAAAEGLKDPGAAKFRSMFVSMAENKDDDDPNPKELWLCGEVNAKNGYGGYVGFRRFASPGAGIMTDDDDKGGFDLIVWQRKCRHKVRDIK